MKYSAGDVVIIRSDLVVGDGIHYYMDDGVSWVGINPSMELYFGKSTVIRDAIEIDGSSYYKLEVDEGLWSWTDEMFEEIPTKVIEQSDTSLQSLLEA